MSATSAVTIPMPSLAGPAFCFRHPGELAIRVVAGTGFCWQCWDEKSDDAILRPTVATVKPFRRLKYSRTGRPRGVKNYVPKSWKPSGVYAVLGVALTKLRECKPTDRPVRFLLRGRSAYGAMSNANTYARRWKMRVVTRMADDSVFIWRTA